MSKKRNKYGFKLIITGTSGVGKTSLLHRYCDNKFEINLKPSIGADFTLKVVDLKKSEVIFTIWDIGGHTNFDNLRNYYYNGSDAGIIVFDVTKMDSVEAIRNKWLEEMRAVGNIPIIILGNKVDIENERMISSSDIKKLSEEFGLHIFETSAKSGENVKKAFETIAKMCMGNDIESIISN